MKTTLFKYINKVITCPKWVKINSSVLNWRLWASHCQLLSAVKVWQPSTPQWRDCHLNLLRQSKGSLSNRELSFCPYRLEGRFCQTATTESLQASWQPRHTFPFAESPYTTRQSCSSMTPKRHCLQAMSVVLAAWGQLRPGKQDEAPRLLPPGRWPVYPALTTGRSCRR